MLTACNKLSIMGEGTSCHFRPGAALLALDDNDSLLFSFVLSVPYSVIRIGKYLKPFQERETTAHLIVESLEDVIKVLASLGCHAHAVTSPTCPLGK